MKQTAVEWFWKKIDEILPFSVDTETGIMLYNAKEKAKKMQKEKHGNAWDAAIHAHFEQDYNENYGKEKS